ncbi:hypothetical protein [Alteromonas sp. 009811495]|uniref:hypothetical protein n=1 Tax=Alteromonas sp. 009811495 TaxID=3002962 RepID=UPI00237E5D89|nr:hypothetical protein [Alteromonas sp. 009811495]WDT85602.1 hypothetical protein OZ660_16980 [Alteromonas sp. 009811495]
MTLDILKETDVMRLNEIKIDTSKTLSIFSSIADKLGIKTEFNLFIEQIAERSKAVLAMNDSTLLEEFDDKFRFISPNSPWENHKDSFVKVNHGFWEMFAYLLANGKSNLRKRNFQVLQAQLQDSHLLPYLMASIQYCIRSSNIVFMQSLTSGIGWSSGLFEQQKTNGLDQIRRGVITGNLVNLAFGVDDVNDFVDSFPLNYGYQEGELRTILAKLDEGDSILLVAPPHLNKLKVNPNIFAGEGSPKQFYLAMSPDQALQQWDKQLENIRTAIEHLRSESKQTVVLFQGAVLGPMVAPLIEFQGWHEDTRVLDLGRLLDIEVDINSLSLTGSPLPNRSVKPSGLFTVVDGNNKCFQERK